jgi:hypothetical protein
VLSRGKARKSCENRALDLMKNLPRMMRMLLGKDFLRVASATSPDDGSRGFEYYSLVGSKDGCCWFLEVCFAGSRWDSRELAMTSLQ